MAVTLLIHKGPNPTVREVEVTKSVIKIGRLPTSDIQIDEPLVSRMHAIIEVSADGTLHVMDLSSATGTWVKTWGKTYRVNKATLRSGDTVVIGETRIEVTIDERIDNLTPAPPSSRAAPFAPFDTDQLRRALSRFKAAFSERLLEMATAPDAPISIPEYEAWMTTGKLPLSLARNRSVRDALAACWQDAWGYDLHSDEAIEVRARIHDKIGAPPIFMLQESP